LKRFCSAIILLSFLFFSARFLLADPGYFISGVVRDAKGVCISHAHVALRKAGSSVVLVGVTGEQGEFHIAVPGAGDYQVEVVFEGFQPLTEQATVSEQSPVANLNLTLNLPSQEYVLIDGDNTTFVGLNLGGMTALGQRILGGLALTTGNIFSQDYRGSALYLKDGNIDLAVAPEPGTWGMMLGGVAILVFMQIRRRRLNS